MKINKPKFWDQKKISLISIFLFPLSLVTLLVVFFKKKFLFIKYFRTPIVCVGNIYIGGTGKTPTSILLGKELLNQGLKSVIIRKYYKNHQDEYNQIRSSFKNLIINKNRYDGIKEAEKNDYDIVILDDGLQDYRIKKNLEIVCFNENQLIGNGLVIPAGPLRENLNALKNVDIVLINGNKNPHFEERLLKINKKLEIYYSYYKPENLEIFKNQNLLVLAGIANPENFFQLLEKYNLKVEEKLVFPDHYRFSESEIQKIVQEADRKKLKIIMTEKDFFKINNFKIRKIDYLRVSLQIYDKEKLINKIKKLYD
tara:strand:- start:88 stop:1023 length:936 start_codon:yes stop_codon:yes gene_type:complete